MNIIFFYIFLFYNTLLQIKPSQIASASTFILQLLSSMSTYIYNILTFISVKILAITPFSFKNHFINNFTHRNSKT